MSAFDPQRTLWDVATILENDTNVLRLTGRGKETTTKFPRFGTRVPRDVEPSTLASPGKAVGVAFGHGGIAFKEELRAD